jgi:hypothetical protein
MSAASFVSLARLVPALALVVLGSGCGPTDKTIAPGAEEGPLPFRPAAVVIDSCPLDTAQRAQLASTEMRRVVGEVILLCLHARENGAVEPTEPEAAARLRADMDELRGEGYEVRLGLNAGETQLQVYRPDVATKLVSDPAWRAQVVAGVKPWMTGSSGLDLAFPVVSDSARDPLTALITALSSVARARGTFGLFVPPATASPSDWSGANAYDLASAFGDGVDKLRVMTLDYSCCAPPGGPSIDPGWAVDALRFNASQVPTAQPFVTMPLFGTDFGPDGARSVTYLEAQALGEYFHGDLTREATGALHLAYVDAAGSAHDLWYDDIFSTRLALSAWASPTLDSHVGVLFYGVGAEEPGLWASLARSEQ